MTVQCFEIIAHGQVQGVGFRYGTMQIATQLNITGSVQNLPNGTVKIIAEGNQNSLNKFISLIKKGPTPFSKVSKLEVRDLPTAQYQLFVIK
ncbi:acylphosphatase [Limosilactobacillus fastidiosus]|uniref:acylphosphatase n=1 Tax=Limosilactobacillus fastidiosus TaxID=2759855 RepID=A0A7W3U0N0_9LACO|nr:acylphosphatase [Limosilactobacillus fastidiosus]MBB1063705.1 acylphosphatase [Limosilactobacillus fastidiosus]MBB1086766.1 acylphosphatase [Limosilactobacillus fastidiosus]MCD7084280.1 acylphosphatase [Limosilactobacillus fastidiosus]MCD7085507.1 acylphosphatase [Limosilactobacillus fastidiosus]MCD7114738.1 acylphosphatase [Limosilactobacillus fastidiosus]